MNRYPDSKDSDDWGVQPGCRLRDRLQDDELKQYRKYRADSSRTNPGEARPADFADRQLQKALARCSSARQTLNRITPAF